MEYTVIHRKCLKCEHIIDLDWAINNKGLCAACVPVPKKDAEKNTGFLDRLMNAIEQTNATSKFAARVRGGENIVSLSADDWQRIYQTIFDLKRLIDLAT